MLSLDTIAADDDVDEVCIGQLCDSSSLVAEDKVRCCCVSVIMNDEFPVVAVVADALLLVSGAERIFVFSVIGVLLLFTELRAPAAPSFGEELTSKV